MDTESHNKRVLFVCSGNKIHGISPIVKAQAETLQKLSIEVDFFAIQEKGILGYLRHISTLRKTIKNGNYYAVHAHYSWCGFIAVIASPSNRNIVVSLMGSFKKLSFKYYLIHLFSSYFWKVVIVKSEKMKTQINLRNAYLVPNGVDLERYKLVKDREEIRLKLGFNQSKKYVIFVSDPERPEKNYKLAQEAVERINNQKVELIPVYNRFPQEVAHYQVAADVLILTSSNEGSPNVIKEAMAACCPIVTTDVGDVRKVIGETEGCYVANGFEVNNISDTLLKALAFGARTTGKSRIQNLRLDSVSIAHRLLQLYDLKNA